jgi:hypothetical protein
MDSHSQDSITTTMVDYVFFVLQVNFNISVSCAFTRCADTPFLFARIPELHSTRPIHAQRQLGVRDREYDQHNA